MTIKSKETLQDFSISCKNTLQRNKFNRKRYYNMRKHKSNVYSKNNGDILIELDNETKRNIEKILATSQNIFSSPLSNNQCQLLLDTIIDMQLAYSDDIADLEDVIEATADSLELFEYRLKGGGMHE